MYAVKSFQFVSNNRYLALNFPNNLFIPMPKIHI